MGFDSMFEHFLWEQSVISFIYTAQAKAKQDPFPCPGECGKESLYTKRSHCSPYPPIKIRQASKCTARCREMSKYVQGLVPLRHIPDDRRETAHAQLSPSLEKQGKFPHPWPKGKFLLPVFPAYPEQRGERLCLLLTWAHTPILIAELAAYRNLETLLNRWQRLWHNSSTSGNLWQAFFWQIKSHISRQKLILFLTDWNNTLIITLQ